MCIQWSLCASFRDCLNKNFDHCLRFWIKSLDVHYFLFIYLRIFKIVLIILYCYVDNGVLRYWTNLEIHLQNRYFRKGCQRNEKANPEAVPSKKIPQKCKVIHEYWFQFSKYEILRSYSEFVKEIVPNHILANSEKIYFCIFAGRQCKVSESKLIKTVYLFLHWFLQTIIRNQICFVNKTDLIYVYIRNYINDSAFSVVFVSTEKGK